MFDEKCWVKAKNVDLSKKYDLGDFLRVWRLHDECWCSASLGVECCAIYLDHMNEQKMVYGLVFRKLIKSKDIEQGYDEN